MLPQSVLFALGRRRARAGDEARGIPLITDVLVKSKGRDVRRGPFVGMHYVTASHSSSYVPKLLGSYEEELHELIGSYRQQNYKLVVDIGSAEGYYAVGMALVTQAQVLAFELDPVARKLCHELARLNGVEGRVEVQKGCTIESLQKVSPEGRTLIICDCEGFEYILLRPDQVSWLKRADLLVELHRADSMGDAETFLARFRETHSVERIPSRARNPRDYPELEVLNEEQKMNAVGEFRAYPQEWAILTALS